LWFDLPRHAEAKESLHLFDRRGAPSFEEGIGTSPNDCPPRPCRLNGFHLHSSTSSLPSRLCLRGRRD
jgi:hypothetical protein